MSAFYFGYLQTRQVWDLLKLGTNHIPFNGRTYHAALNNDTDQQRRVLIFNYGHFWMKPWQGYEPSAALQARATTPVRRQLLHLGEAYGQSLASSK